MKKTVFIFMFIASVSILSGCSNTLDGAGRDISKAGDKISETF